MAIYSMYDVGASKRQGLHLLARLFAELAAATALFETPPSLVASGPRFSSRRVGLPAALWIAAGDFELAVIRPRPPVSDCKATHHALVMSRLCMFFIVEWPLVAKAFSSK
jgi:hypothetical protein